MKKFEVGHYYKYYVADLPADKAKDHKLHRGFTLTFKVVDRADSFLWDVIKGLNNKVDAVKFELVSCSDIDFTDRQVAAELLKEYYDFIAYTHLNIETDSLNEYELVCGYRYHEDSYFYLTSLDEVKKEEE